MVAEVTEAADSGGATLSDSEIAAAIVTAIEESTSQVTGCRILKVTEKTGTSRILFDY